MRAAFSRMISIVWIVSLSALTGCSSILTQETTQPTPDNPALVSALARITRTPSPYQIVSDPTCVIRSWETVKTISPQGDLIAWSPDGASLAYLSPKPSYNWFSGDLSLISTTDFQNPEALTSQVDAAGEITWSPDGTRLAFIALNRSQQVYTVMALTLADRGLVDLFPGDQARTDPWSSPKAVLGWSGSDRLQVAVSCGAGCIQSMEMDVSGQTSATLIAQQHGDIKIDDWAPKRNKPTPASLPGVEIVDPNLSPDGKKLVYLDADGNFWGLLFDSQERFSMVTPFLTVSETKWSPDSRLLAIRTDGLISILELPCIYQK